MGHGRPRRDPVHHGDLGDRRCPAGPRPGRPDRLPDADGAGRHAGRLRRAEGGMGALDDLPVRGALRGPDRAAGHGLAAPRRRRPAVLDGRVVPRDRGLRGLRRHRPRGEEPAVHDPVRALPRGPGPHRLGDLDVRLVRRLRAPPPAQRDRRARHRPARDDVGLDRRPAALPGGLHRRLAPAADPVARARGAGRVDPPADRRPGLDLEHLPARRDHLHRRGGRGLAGPHGDGVVGTAAERLDGGRRIPRRARALVAEVPAGRRQHHLVRGRLRPVGHEHRWPLEPLDDRGDDDHPAGGRAEGPLLAGGRLRPVHRQRLAQLADAERDPARRRPRPGRVERRRDRGRPQGADLHGRAGRGPDRTPRVLAADPGPRLPGDVGRPDQRRGLPERHRAPRRRAVHGRRPRPGRRRGARAAQPVGAAGRRDRISQGHLDVPADPGRGDPGRRRRGEAATTA